MLTLSFDNIDSVQVFRISQVKHAVRAQLWVEQRAIQHLQLSYTSIRVRGKPRVQLLSFFKALSIRGNRD